MSYPFHRIYDDLGYVEISVSGTTSNVYALGPASDTLIVDTGSSDTADGVVESLADAGYRPRGVRAIWITHGHADHYGGAGRLADWSGAELWASPATALDVEDRWGAFIGVSAPTAKSGPAAWEAFTDRGGPGVRVDRLVRDGERIEHAGLTLEAIRTPGHHRGAMTLFEPDRGLAFVGDLVQGGMDVSANWLGLFSDVASQRRSLARVGELDPRWLLKGHRQPRGGEEVRLDLASAVARLDAIESVLLVELDKAVEGLTLAAATRVVLDRVLDRPPDALPPYAVTSVSAFLIDLTQRGLARRSESLTWSGPLRAEPD